MARAFFFQKVKGKLPSLNLFETKMHSCYSSFVVAWFLTWDINMIWKQILYKYWQISNGNLSQYSNDPLNKGENGHCVVYKSILITNTYKFTKQILIRLQKCIMKPWEIQNRKETNTAILVIFLLMDSSWEQVESSADSSQSPRPHICIILHSQPLIGFFVQNVYFFLFFFIIAFCVSTCLRLLIWCYEL